MTLKEFHEQIGEMIKANPESASAPVVTINQSGKLQGDDFRVTRGYVSDEDGFIAYIIL